MKVFPFVAGPVQQGKDSSVESQWKAKTFLNQTLSFALTLKPIMFGRAAVFKSLSLLLKSTMGHFS